MPKARADRAPWGPAGAADQGLSLKAQAAADNVSGWRLRARAYISAFFERIYGISP